MYNAKFPITEKLLWDLFPAINAKRGRDNKAKNIKGFVYTFNKYADYFGIDTLLETKHFITQIAVESDQWNAYEEYASGNAYDSRTDLGNTKAIDGDGAFFKGHGGIQTTGKHNYDITGDEMAELPFLTDAERALFLNDGLLKNPKLLVDPVWGTLSSFLYWTNRDLNLLAQPDNVLVTITRLKNGKWQKYQYSPIDAISFKVNGGWNGIEERRSAYKKLTKALI